MKKEKYTKLNKIRMMEKIKCNKTKEILYLRWNEQLLEA